MCKSPFNEKEILYIYYILSVVSVGAVNMFKSAKCPVNSKKIIKHSAENKMGTHC